MSDVISEPVAAEFRPVDTVDLRFDGENPRIPSDVDPSDEAEVIAWMLTDAGLTELMASIATQGFFPAEPLLVTPTHPTDGSFTVVEGNRRLAAVRLLLHPELAPRRIKAVQALADQARESGHTANLMKLPCAVMDRREEILDYLGFRHITGVKSWDADAKARYLDSLYRTHLPAHGPNVYRHIARLIGSRADYVQRLLGALRLYEIISTPATRETLGVAAEDIAFSYLTLALNYNDIVAYLGLHALDQEQFAAIDKVKVENLAVWMFKKRSDGQSQLGESRNMKYLALAVRTAPGLDALLSGESAYDSARESADEGEMIVAALRVSLQRLTSAERLLSKYEENTIVAPAQELAQDIVRRGAAVLDELSRRD